MNEEKKMILDRINQLIDKRKDELLQRFPYIHEIGDGIVIRFFTSWDNCKNNEEIKYKKIINESDNKDITVLHYIPKNTKLEFIKREYVKTVLCISGKLELIVDNETIILDEHKKIHITNSEFEGYTYEDTYVITQNK